MNLPEHEDCSILARYAHAFSPLRIRKLTDALVGLDLMAAVSRARAIERAIGKRRIDKILTKLSSRLGPLPNESRPTKPKQVAKRSKK